MAILDGVKAVIFDLDGTLYQDDVVWYDLIRYYTEGTPYQPLTEEIVKYAKDFVEGKKEIKCGCFAPKEEVQGEVSVENLFAFPAIKGLAAADPYLFFDRSKYSYIGDGWTLSMYIAHRLGFYGEEFWRRFHKARVQLLMGPGEQVWDERITVMLETMRNAGIILLLCTNSTHDNSSALLNKLRLTDKFDELIHSARKPLGLVDRIELLRKNYSLEYEEILLVGDQGYSDLFVGQELGAKTLMSTSCFVDDGMKWTQRVYTIDELAAELMKGLEKREKKHYIG